MVYGLGIRVEFEQVADSDGAGLRFGSRVLIAAPDQENSDGDENPVTKNHEIRSSG